ncbi:MAG: M23 family metallopeptidase [Prevotellaceae bacterium]|jgi:murein DD-endopeptidase MepM/ murein hydrolase activator NlpD|nr:M23 family metallopeptidase [Prevotellaceae bacterium]
MAKKGKSRYIRKLRSKYRLIIYNDMTYAEVWYMRLSRLNVLTFFGVITLVVVAAVVSLIAFTPLREFIPGYPDSKTRRNIVQNAQRLDSLEQKVQRWVLYNDNLSRILSGEEPVDIETASDSSLAQRYQAIMLTHSIEDSLFRRQVEEMEQLNLTMLNTSESPSNGNNLYFFPPVRGQVASTFNPQEQRFGVGITPASGSAVMAARDGILVAANWTIENGYVIAIQHNLNIVTIYKNNKQLFKQVGVHVNAGEIIAITDAGKDNGTLLFEIWNNGTPVNPEQYIVF